jgi:hypothetical protein
MNGVVILVERVRSEEDDAPPVQGYTSSPAHFFVPPALSGHSTPLDSDSANRFLATPGIVRRKAINGLDSAFELDI